MPAIAELVNYISNWAGTGGHDLHVIDLGEFPVGGWEGFPVRRFKYTKTDPDGTNKVGEVALLDADAARIATWIYSATIAVLGAYDRAKAQQLVDECGKAGGFQFPVRGVHWENMEEIFTAYTFFDGVTVSLNGWKPAWPTRPLSQQEIDFALNANWNDVQEAHKYARIQSTTRDDYKANGGKLPTDGKEWLNVVRKCYQNAWFSDENELMTAKARSIFLG